MAIMHHCIGNRHRKYQILRAEWRTTDQHFIIALRAARLQEAGACQATSSFAPRRARKLPSPVARTGGQKSHKTPSRGRGWPLKVPPRAPGVLLYPRDATCKRAGLFLSMCGIFPKAAIFSEPHTTCLISGLYLPSTVYPRYNERPLLAK